MPQGWDALRLNDGVPKTKKPPAERVDAISAGHGHGYGHAVLLKNSHRHMEDEGKGPGGAVPGVGWRCVRAQRDRASGTIPAVAQRVPAVLVVLRRIGSVPYHCSPNPGSQTGSEINSQFEGKKLKFFSKKLYANSTPGGHLSASPD